MKKTFTQFNIAKLENGWTVEECWTTPDKNGCEDYHDKKYICKDLQDVIDTVNKIAKEWKLK